MTAKDVALLLEKIDAASLNETEKHLLQQTKDRVAVFIAEYPTRDNSAIEITIQDSVRNGA